MLPNLLIKVFKIPLELNFENGKERLKRAKLLIEFSFMVGCFYRDMVVSFFEKYAIQTLRYDV